MDLLVAGYVKNPYEKCLFTLFSDKDTSEGQVLIDVDDFIEGGTESHGKAMDIFYEKYLCGKSVDLGQLDEKGHCSLVDESYNIKIIVSLCPWMSM